MARLRDGSTHPTIRTNARTVNQAGNEAVTSNNFRRARPRSCMRLRTCASGPDSSRERRASAEVRRPTARGASQRAALSVWIGRSFVGPEDSRRLEVGGMVGSVMVRRWENRKAGTREPVLTMVAGNCMIPNHDLCVDRVILEKVAKIEPLRRNYKLTPTRMLIHKLGDIVDDTLVSGEHAVFLLVRQLRHALRRAR